VKILIALATTVALVGPVVATAHADDRIPDQFVGNWCSGPNLDSVGWGTEEATVYSRSKGRPARRSKNNLSGIGTCPDAHEPEDVMTIKPNRLWFGGEDTINCKLLQIVHVTRHDTHQIKFWCKSNGTSSWMYEVLIAPQPGGKIAFQELPKETNQ
jgi:hypothetical protein